MVLHIWHPIKLESAAVACSLSGFVALTSSHVLSMHAAGSIVYDLLTYLLNKLLLAKTASLCM